MNRIHTAHYRYHSPVAAKLGGVAFLTHELRAERLGISPRGGVTVVTLVNPSGQAIGIGYAVCSPRDNYVRTIGRGLALERMLLAKVGVQPAQNMKALLGFIGHTGPFAPGKDGRH